MSSAQLVGRDGVEVEVDGYLLTATASKKMSKLQCMVSANLAHIVILVIDP